MRVCRIMDLKVPDHRVKLKVSKKKDNYLNLAGELEKTMEREGDGDITCDWCTWDNPKRIGKGTRRFENQRTSGDHPDYSIIKIGQNTEKSPGNLRRLAVPQTPLKNNQLMLVGKPRKENKIITIISKVGNHNRG